MTIRTDSDALQRVAPYLTGAQLELCRRHEHMSEPDSAGWDVAEAIYWLGADYHEGQASNLYMAMCATEFEPSILAHGVTPNSGAAMLLNALVDNLRGLS